MSASSAACAVSCRGSASSSSRGARHRERQDQPVRLRQGQRAFGRLVRRALVTELAMGEPGQQVRLHDRDVSEDRGRAIQNIGAPRRGLRPDRLPRGRSPRGHCGSRRSWPARHRAPRAGRGPRRSSRGGPGWPAASGSSGSPAPAIPLAAIARCSAAPNSSSASWWRPRPACSMPAVWCSSSLMSGPVSVCRACRFAAAIARPRRTHPSRPSWRRALSARARSPAPRPSRTARRGRSPRGSAAGSWRTSAAPSDANPSCARQPTSR